MESSQSFSGLIDRWPSAADLARDIGVKEVTARAWKARGIPAQYWTEIIAAAVRRRIEGVSLETLAALASRESDATNGEVTANDFMPPRSTSEEAA